jgi:uncharacterized protein
VIYEWNEAKRAANLVKHRVDFAAARLFEWDTSIQRLDTRRDYGELRCQALGFVGDRLHMLVFTERSGRIRVISLREANCKEFDRYEEKCHSADPGGR